jgi:L-amino acid N-acyltransferase YncA
VTGAIHFDPTSTFAQLAEQLVTLARLSDARAAWVAARTLSEPDAPLVDSNEVAGSMTSKQTSLSWRPWRTYVALIQQAVVIDMTTSARAASA